MYIPDKVRILGHRQSVQVFSADPGHEQDGALQVSKVSVHYQAMSGLVVAVTYGSSVFEIGQPEPPAIRIEYAASNVTFDLQHK